MEKLYNNVILEDGFAAKCCDFFDTPYLKSPPEVIDVSVGRQLFVDNFLIDNTDLSPEHHKAKKYEGNPVLFPEESWERERSPAACPKSGGVWYDEDEKIFKMWYEGTWLGYMCYATSEDGIHWHRPVLNDGKTNIILPYERGESDEAIPFPNDTGYLRPDSTTVWIDYDAPRGERYKLFLRNPGAKYPAIIGVSEDGINFRDLRYTGVVDDRSTMFYDVFRKKWIFSIRSQKWNGRFNRCRKYYECDDFYDAADWDADKESFWMKTDELDLPRADIGERPHLYNVDCVGYESITLGMFQILYGPDNNTCAKRGMPKITELMPMYSRDGYHFTRPSRESIIAPSKADGAWDKGYVQSVGGVTIINGDELWIYYIAFAGDGSKTGDEETIGNGMYCNGATGLAKLRRDGFVSMNGDGKLTTRKLKFFGKEDMYVNVDGRVCAKILDENGEILACSEVFCGDSTKAKLNFDGFEITELNGRVFRIEFTVCGKLYSFGFADASGDFGGAHAAGEVRSNNEE